MRPKRVVAPVRAYGKACEECFKSKSKCVNSTQGNTCQRCHRLRKACIARGDTRALKAKKNNTIQRIAQLEGKIDSLVSLLGAVVTADSQHTTAQPSPPPSLPSSSQSPATPLPVPAFELSNADAVHYLEIFDRHMLKYFPFLNIATDAQTLRQERPFLFLCIVAVATPSTHLKMVLGKRIKQTLADRIILEPANTTDIDLLLGLLTFLAWSHDYLINKNPASLSRFTQLAMTLVFDMRLNKPLSQESNLLPVGGQNGECSSQLCHSTQSLEEIRALLSCFVMSSIVSSYLGHIDPLQWNPYMEECLEFLSTNSECPGDDSLVCQVRLQLIANESDSARVTKTPAIFYVKTLITKVDRIKLESPSIQTDRILLSSVYYTQIGILSMALSDLSSSDMKRVEHHGACVETIRMALDNFFEVPVSEYTGTSFPFFAHLARSIVILFKLSTMNDLILDRALVLSSVDILQILDMLIQNIRQARSTAGDESTGGLLDRSTEIFTSVRSWCGIRLAEMEQSDSNTSTTELGFTDTGLFDFFPFEDSWVRNSFTSEVLNSR